MIDFRLTTSVVLLDYLGIIDKKYNFTTKKYQNSLTSHNDVTKNKKHKIKTVDT